MPTYRSTKAPASSPWGKPDDTEELAPGVWEVDTPSHGGIKLSRQRNAEVPAYMRIAGGWYEEDCDWAIAATAHPEICKTDVMRKAAANTLRNWHPEHYERFYGVRLTGEQSHTRRRQEQTLDNRGKWVAIAAWGDWAKWVPDGKTGICAKLGGREGEGTEERWYLVDAERYNAFNYVVDSALDFLIEAPADHGATKRTG